MTGSYSAVAIPTCPDLVRQFFRPEAGSVGAACLTRRTSLAFHLDRPTIDHPATSLGSAVRNRDVNRDHPCARRPSDHRERLRDRARKIAGSDHPNASTIDHR